MKKLLSILLGIMISMQSMSFTPITHADTPLRTIEVCFDKYFYDDEDVTEITLTEGETVQLVLPDPEPDMPKINYISFSTSQQGAAVTQDLKLTGLSAGEEYIHVYVGYDGVGDEDIVAIKAHILKNESIPAETRKELERLENLDGYYRRRMELLGAIDEDAPRLTMDKVQEIIDTSKDYFDIFAKLNEYHIIADQKPDGGNTDFIYWLDDKGNESITWNEGHYVFYSKTTDKGTNEAGQFLYPEKSELLEGDGGYNYEYLRYNQIKPEGTCKVTLNIIDGSTGEPFTDTDGTFRLIKKHYFIYDDFEETVYKSWNISDGSTVSFDGLPIESAYEIQYIDEYHEDENGELYKYEVDQFKGVHDFSFGLIPDEYSFNVYMKKQYKNSPIYIGQSVKGDINTDGAFNIADVAVFQKWLLGDSFYGGDIKLNNWKAADLCNDGRLDVFDLCLMKQELLKNGKPAELPTLIEISEMSNEEATELFSKYTFQDIECIWKKFDYYHSGLYGGGWEIGDKKIGFSFDFYTQKLDWVMISPLPTEDE